MPVMMGDERIGGVRVGMSLRRVRELESGANASLLERLAEVGKRDLGWLLLLLAGLAFIATVVAIYVQRTLVGPIRWLAQAARQIESRRLRGGAAQQRPQRRSRRTDPRLRPHEREHCPPRPRSAAHGLYRRPHRPDQPPGLRESLDHQLLAARNAGRQLALLFADIDDFKRVNDTLGHEAGDEALLQFASRISAAVEALGGDEALLARFGGDEFVILLQAGDVREAAQRLADRLVQDLGQPLLVEGREVFLGTSIGITLFPDDARGATALLKNGDIAMYQAKVAGKNCHRFYSRAMDHAVERRVHMEHELRGPGTAANCAWCTSRSTA